MKKEGGQRFKSFKELVHLRMAKSVLEEIKSTLKEKEVHWEIPNISSLYCYEAESPRFRFLGVQWYLKITPYKDAAYRGEVGLNLQLDDKGTVSCNVLCTFGIKKNDSSLIGVRLFHHTFNKKTTILTSHHFFNISALSQRESELMRSGALTIVCNLKELADPVKLTGLNTLSENIKGLLTDQEFCDITLNVKDRVFRVHRNILAARSPVFAAMFKHETSEKQTGIVNISDCNPESFQVFMEYLYSGQLENISCKNVFDVYEIAEKYDVQELKMFCIVYMEHNLKVENVCDVVVFVEERDEKLLHGVVQEFFNRNAKEILANDNWKTLSKNYFSLANKLLIEMASYVKVENGKWEVS